MHNPQFLFHSETKLDIASVVDKFKGCNPTFSCGVEPVGASNLAITCVFCSTNFVIRSVEESSVNTCYIMFFYGSPIVGSRPLV